MRLLLDLHISPLTAAWLADQGHDVIRVPQILPASASDAQIVAAAIHDNRVILTQDLDFSSIVALSGRDVPSIIHLRLATSRIEHVNSVLTRVLPQLTEIEQSGTIVTVTENRIRRRRLPIRL